MSYTTELNNRPITDLFEKFPQAYKHLALSLNEANISKNKGLTEENGNMPKALLIYLKERMKINTGENFNYKK